MTSCFICGRPVLGLAGLDAHLDTYMWNTDVDSSPIETGMYGYCHLACLGRDPAGAAWYPSLLTHFQQSLRFFLHDDSAGLKVLYSERPERYLLIWDNGVHYFLSAAEYQSSLAGEPIRRRSKQRIEIDLPVDSMADFVAAIRRPGGLSLEQFYRSVSSPSSETTFDGFIQASAKDVAEAFIENSNFDGEIEASYSFRPVQWPA